MVESKILFITNLPFNETGSNGKTFLSLFADFNDNQVAQLFFNNVNPSSTKFNNYYRLTEIDILKNIFTKNAKITGSVNNTLIQKINVQNISRLKFNTEFLIKIIRNFLFSKINITKIDSFENWIKTFNPNVIFFVGSSYNYSYQILNEISTKYQLPYYIYFTDDYFIYNKGNNWLSKAFHKRFVKKAKVIVGNAQELFVISEKMQEEFGNFFNKNCSILINAVDTHKTQEGKGNFNNPIVFRYFGWLHSNRSSSLGYLGQCLKYIFDNFKIHCTLEVYSLSVLNANDKQSLSIDTIKVLNPIMGEKFLEILNLSDFLVHAESFELKDTKVTMLSVSTKIPEYLLSNRCIVAIGPPELASMSVLQENNLAVIISKEKTIEENSLQILKVIEDKEVYNQYCERAIKYCKTEFNSVEMRKMLKDKLSRIK